MSTKTDLTVAVTGASGTVGAGVVSALEADDRVSRIVGVTRTGFDPAVRGWTRTTSREADVRDPEALTGAFASADVVVHLAFITTGTASRETIRSINVDGTTNAIRATAEVGAARFVWTSSVAAYGFHADNPVPMTEDWPTRPSEDFFYARQKADLESLLNEEAAAAGIELYLVRPAIVLGPDPVGAKVPGSLGTAVNRLLDWAGRSPVAVPVPAPEFPFQVVHQADVGAAISHCATGDGAPGAYNVAADGTLTGVELVRELGLTPVPIPAGAVQRPAAAAMRIPWPLPAAEWIEAGQHPAIMDTAKAKRELGWTPRYDGVEVLRETLTR